MQTVAGFLERPAARIYYEVSGSGPALVFAHGLGGNHLSWWQQAPYFARDYTCVTFAHRGFAPSTGDPPDPRLFGDDLEALIDRLKLAEVRLVAQSMGGWCCLEYALRHPERVAKLVLADTAGTVDFATLDPPGREKVAEWQSRNRGAIEELFRKGIHPAAGERMAREQSALHFLYREIDRLSNVGDKDLLRARLMEMRTLPVSRLSEMRTPVLFICGEEDVVFPPPAAAALAASMPNAELRLVADTGHSVYFERAAIFNGLVGSFL